MEETGPIVFATHQNNVTRQANISNEELNGLSFGDLISQILSCSYTTAIKDDKVKLEELINDVEIQDDTYLMNANLYNNLLLKPDVLNEDISSIDINEKFIVLLDELQDYLTSLQNFFMGDANNLQEKLEMPIKASNSINNEQMVTEKQDSIIIGIFKTLDGMENILENNLNNSKQSITNMVVEKNTDILIAEQILDEIKDAKTNVENGYSKLMTKTEKTFDESLVLMVEKTPIQQGKTDMDITYLKEKISEILNNFDIKNEKITEKNESNMSNLNLKDKEIEVSVNVNDIQKKLSREGDISNKLFEVNPEKNDKITALFKNLNVMNNESKQNESETSNKERTLQINTKDTHASPEKIGKPLNDLNFHVQESPEKMDYLMKNVKINEAISPKVENSSNQMPFIKNIAPLQVELTKHLQQIGDKGRSILTVQLQPKELGRMKIELELREGIVNVKIFVEGETAKQALQHHLQAMKDQIKNQGITLESLEVNISNEAFNDFSQQEEQNKYKPRKWDNKILYEADNTEMAIENNNYLSVNRLNILA